MQATLLGMKATSKLLLSAEQVSSGRVVSSLLSCRWFSSTVNFNLEQIIEDSKIFSETSDGEDIDGRESTYGGHAQNILSSPDESIGKIDDFLSFERGFVNGDVVCSVTDPSGQLGRVMDVVMVVELERVSGNVIGYKDECVEVRWASGHVSKVSPFEIFGLDMILSPASMLSSNEETFPANVIKETPDQQKLLSHKKKKNVENNSNEDCTTNKLEVSQYQLLKKELQLGLHNEQLEILRRETIEFKQGDEPIILPEDDKPIKFKQFNVVNDFSDHHFINGIGDGIARSQVKRGWFKKVQQEWSILKRDLPDTIYVRVYEEKMELMRAAILGSPGTPFHDGLFLFDIFFPPDYPHEPPLPGCLDGAQRSHHILNACKAYLDGAQVGHLYSMEGLPAKAAKL
ncbi:hypothetical protein MUK42_18200, partial [Musa troglodytarum]